MTEFELVFNYRDVSERLQKEGYNVSAVRTGFFIHDSTGKIVGDVFTVEGLRGFLQGLQWANEAHK